MEAGLGPGPGRPLGLTVLLRATILMQQHTVDNEGHEADLKARGRHDACVLPRAVPIVEAMAAMTILDYYLLNKAR